MSANYSFNEYDSPNTPPFAMSILQRESAHLGNSGFAHGIVIVPEGISGSCEVRNCMGDNYIYQELYRNGKLLDANDPCNLRGHMPFIREAGGELLVANAGLGGFLYRLVRNPRVFHVTVAEPDFDVIELVEPSFSCFADKVTFVHGTWQQLARSNDFDQIYLG